MKRLFNVLAVITCTMFFTACEYYDHAITGHEDRLSQLENSYLKSVEEQIEGINASLYHLEAIDTVLYALKDSLAQEVEKNNPLLPDDDTTEEGEENEGEDTGEDAGEDEGSEAIKRNAEEEHTDLLALMSAIDTEVTDFDNKIADLKNYVASGIPSMISSPQEWIEITLATMEQYIAVQTEVAKIKSLIEIHESDITTSYLDAFDRAFAECEASMKGWVNEALAENYYKVATVDGELDVLESKADSTNNALTEQIVAQQEALDTAKAHLTVAYEKAIAEAIDINNGRISEEIALAVLEAQDALQSQVDAITRDIEYIKAEILTIKEDIGYIQDDIATIGEQIEGINSSLEDLTKVDSTLQILIDTLEAKAESLQEQLEANSAADAVTKQELEEKIANINALIAALQAKNEEFDQKIDDLKAYVNDEISATEDWAEATFATLEDYTAMQTDIATLEALIETYKQELTDDYTAAIATAVAALQTDLAGLETSMKQWVNETLAQGYYNIATIDGKLAALETKLANADADLAKQIAEQQAALEQAKAELTAAYEAAIKKAIEENNGKITEEINAAVKKATDELNTEINEIWNEIADINKSIETINNQIESINNSLGQLKEKNEALQDLIDVLEAKAEDLQKQFEAADAATKQELERQIATIENLIAILQEEDKNLQKQIDDLQKQIEDLKKGSVSKDDITAIERAIDALEAQMDNLEKTLGDIDAINRRLDELEQKADNYATDKELSDAIDAIYDKLDELYDAINNGGNTGEDWSDDIADIYETLNDIMDRLDDLENLGGGNASGNIQSIRFIPEYNDGKVDLSSGLATLTFILTPNEAASAIAQTYRTNSNVVTAYITRTKSRTRAVDTPRRMTVTTVSGNANGMLEVSVNASSLPAEYWDGSTSCNIYIHINDGNNDIVSEMIPTYQSTPNTATVEAVDLGLSVKWASCNVGAYSSESYGSYYTWSETNNIDFSDNWRMPTASEMRELRDNCDWRWTNVNGISGYRVTGKNGNSIFLPASGFKLNNRTFDEGSYGYYWSSGSGSQANYLEFNSYDYDVNGSEPTYGCTVRPVRP